MDPFTAIGLAGNIITFIDFAFEIISATREIHGSVTGTTSENKDLEFLTNKLTSLSLNLQHGKSTSLMTEDERNLNDLAIECVRLSVDLLGLLEKLKAGKSGSTKKTLRAVWRNVRKKKEKTDLEKRLENCRQQLHLQLTSNTRSETFQRLNQVIDSGELQQNELASLQRNVDALRSCLDAKHITSGDLDQIRSVLGRSDQALTRVYQNLILDGLRFEKMNERFEDVKDAHMNTFSWILGGSDADSGYNKNESDSSEASVNNHLDDKGDLGDSDATDDMNDSNDTEGATESDADDLEHVEDDVVYVDYVHEDKDRQLQLQARDQFVDWLKNGNGIFHVSGKPGAGKSTLMKYLCEHPRTTELAEIWSGTKQLVIAKFFFWRPGTEFQKSLKGLLRGLLHCILDQSPDLIHEVFPKQWESAKYQRSINFDEGDIRQAFDWIIDQSTIYDQRNFLFFIDGLDEFEGEHAKMIRQLFRWVSTRQHDIKICVSSREELIFQERFSMCPKMRLHELTRRDIAVFVRDTLAANEDFASIGKSTNELVTLQQQIIEKSEGVFLWASLAVRTLEQGLLAEDRFQDLERKIESLPAELDVLFQFIFDTMTKGSHPMDCRSAVRTIASVMNLQLVQAQRQDLYLLRYSFMENHLDDPDFAIKRPVCHLSKEEMHQRMRRARKQVYARCKGFLEVIPQAEKSAVPFRDEFIKFIHRSLAEFFQKKDIKERMAPHLMDFNLLDFQCQSFVAELQSVKQDRRYFIEPRPPLDKSKFLTDLQSCVDIFHTWEPKNSARFCEFLDQLTHVINTLVPAQSTAPFCIYTVNSKSPHVGPRRQKCVLDCHLVTHIRLWAIRNGIYEYFLKKTADTGHTYKHCEGDEMLGSALEVSIYPGINEMSPDRWAKTLGYCFEHGISANSHGGFSDDVSSFQRTLWSFITIPPMWGGFTIKFEPIIRLFLLYGADPSFWLVFGPRYEDYEGQEFIRVVSQIGKEKRECFAPIYIDVNLEGIVRFAEEKGWTLSLRDLVEYWFPKRARVLQELIARNVARQGDLQKEEVEELKSMSHLDLDVWKDLSFEEDTYFVSPFKDDFQVITDDFKPSENDDADTLLEKTAGRYKLNRKRT